MDQLQPVVNMAPDQMPNSEVQTQTQLPDAPVVATTSPATQPGDKTPNHLLLESLQEERNKRKELEDKLNILTTTASSDEVYSDEGKLLKDEIDSLKDKMELRELQDRFPQLKELASEFEEFRKDYPRHKGVNIAKLFLSEKELLEPVRKGLENPTGGTRTPQTQEMTPDDIKTLRETNYKRYKEMLLKGLIKV